MVDRVTIQVAWLGRRERMPASLADIMVITEAAPGV
jgi:hypothetical protein